MFQKITLKNGLRIIAVPQKSTQAVTILILVGTGSKYETREINGISHFLEHMYFKGTKKRPDQIVVAETLDRVGGIYNAFTSEEYTGYFAKVAAPYFDLALDWVSDIFLNSLLPEKEVEKERGVIIEEINMYYDNPMAYVHLLWNKLLYGDQPAGWDVAGTKESVSRITRKKLIDYMKNQYTASNTLICLAGSFKGNSFLPKIKKYFSKITKKKPEEKAKVIEKQTNPQVILNQRPTNQTHLCLGVRSYNIFHPHRYTQELLAAILGGMMSSRLFTEIRGKLGLAYYVSTAIDSNPDTGYLMTQAGVDNTKVEKAICAILKEYQKISEKKVPFSEIKKAKDCLKGKTTLLLESSDAKASFYAAQELLEKKILTPKEIFKQIDKVTESEIRKVAKEIFQPQGLNLALVGPFKNKERFEKLLEM